MKEASDKEKLLKQLLKHQCARVAERITDEQFEKLLSGEARLSMSITVRVKKPVPNSDMPPMSMAEHREDFDDVRNRLASVRTRDECAVLTEYILPEKEDLFAFAKFLRIPVQWGESRRRLREKIVEMTAGGRIDADIIRRRR